MKGLLYRVATAVSGGAIVASSFSGVALAGVTVEVSGNGANSENEAEVKVENNTSVSQYNDANIQNNVSVNANTGENKANANTGGETSIDTGNAKADVSVSNQANANAAEIDACCPGDVSVEVSGNGANSENEAEVKVETGTELDQLNDAKVRNNVDVSLNSGDNKANRNTGGDVEIETGDAAANGGVSISNAVNKNLASIGSNGSAGALSIVLSGNGWKSKNEAEVKVASKKLISQWNDANILNNVWIGANTGDNKANRNTGGDVSIGTGNAEASVDVSNMANFNAADVDACDCILDGLVKIAGNGAKSKNEAEVSLASVTELVQGNKFACGRGYHHKPWLMELFPWPWHHHKQPCNDVDVDLNSGDNVASRNTTGDDLEPAISTGDAEADVVVGTDVNSNVLGDGMPDVVFPDLDPPADGFSGLVLLLLAMMAG